MVTSRSLSQRWLHTVVSRMCGRENSCGRKIDYGNQASAERAAITVAKKFGRKFDVYQCGFCRGWHVGGSHNLTVLKFLRILWFWIVKRKKRKV